MLGTGVLILRRYVLESPRWLMIHGKVQEAEKIVCDIEKTVQAKTHKDLGPKGAEIGIRVREKTPFSEIWQYVRRSQPQHSFLGLALMLAQAFFTTPFFSRIRWF